MNPLGENSETSIPKPIERVVRLLCVSTISNGHFMQSTRYRPI